MSPLLDRMAASIDPVRLENYVNALLLLNRIGYTHYEAEFEQLDAVYEETTSIISAMNTVLAKHLRYALAQIGIWMDDDDDVFAERYCNLLKGIYVFLTDGNEDLHLMEDVDDPDRRLFLMLRSVYPLNEAWFYENLLHVDTRLFDMIDRGVTLDVGEPIVDEKSERARLRVKEILGDERGGVIYHFIKRRNALPLPGETVIEALKNELFSLNDQELLRAWAMLAAASVHNAEDARAIFLELADEFLPPERFARLEGALRKALQEVNDDE